MRRPIGLAFCPIQLFVRQSDLDVAAALQNWPGGSSGFGNEAFDSGGGSGDGFSHDEVLGLGAEIVFGVGDGGLKSLGDRAGGFPGDEGEDGLGLESPEALDLADDFAHLLGGHPNVASNGVNLHSELYLASALAV